MNIKRTTSAIARHKQTSDALSVRIEVDPNKVLHTSADIFADFENRFMTRYPAARDDTDMTASIASLGAFVFLFERKSNIAHTIVTGKDKSILLVSFITIATDIAPKATCERLSPTNEYLLRTRVTPRSAEQKAMSTPTMSAYLTNG